MRERRDKLPGFPIPGREQFIIFEPDNESDE